jgi:hypothetical protein
VEMGQLPEQEYAEICDLLGLKPAPVQMVAVPARPQENQSPQRLLLQPLIMKNFDMAALDLNDDQKQVIADLRQSFLQQIGGNNQDTNDPAYPARWRETQRAFDDTLRGRLGGQLYVKLQVQAARSTQ